MPKRDNAPKKRTSNKKLTSNQQEWQHQIRNLKRRIKDLEDLGAYVAFQIPEMPKRVTKSAIEKLKGLRRKQLLKKAYQEGDYGEAVPFQTPEKGKAEERRREVKEKRRAEESDTDYGYDYDYPDEPVDIYRVEIDNLRNLINDIADDEIAMKLHTILDNAIAENGPSAVADTVEKRYSELRETAQQALKYKGSSKGAGAITSFAQILMSRPLSFGDLAELEQVNDYHDDFELPL